MLRPLTIAAGANSSGKSSILQPLLLLKQTLDAPFDPGALRIAGPNVQFTSVEQFLSKLGGQKPQTDFTVSVQVGSTREVSLTFCRDPKSTVSISKMEISIGDRTMPFRQDMHEDEIRQALQAIDYDRRILPFLRNDGEMAGTLQVMRNRSFLEVNLSLTRLPDDSSGIRFALASDVQREISSIIHVPGLRGNPARDYKTSAASLEFPGTFNDYVASIIHVWKTEHDERLQELGSILRDLGLTWKVDTQQIDDTRVEVRVGRLPLPRRGGARDMVSIADVGFGLSQSLPVLVALLAAEPGQLVYLEQPEIHLHPRAQFYLAGVLARAAQRGVRVFAETHSDLLLLGIQTLVAEGELDPETVALHWFTRRPKDGVTEIESATMDRHGAYGDWPADFGELRLDAQDRYLSSLDKMRSRIMH